MSARPGSSSAPLYPCRLIKKHQSIKTIGSRVVCGINQLTCVTCVYTPDVREHVSICARVHAYTHDMCKSIHVCAVWRVCRCLYDMRRSLYDMRHVYTHKLNLFVHARIHTYLQRVHVYHVHDLIYNVIRLIYNVYMYIIHTYLQRVHVYHVYTHMLNFFKTCSSRYDKCIKCPLTQMYKMPTHTLSLPPL